MITRFLPQQDFPIFPSSYHPCLHSKIGLFYIFIFATMDCLMGKCCMFWTCQCHPLALQGRVINKSMWTGRLISCWTMYIYNINMGTQYEGNFQNLSLLHWAFYSANKGDKIVQRGATNLVLLYRYCIFRNPLLISIQSWILFSNARVIQQNSHNWCFCQQLIFFLVSDLLHHLG